MTVDDLIHAVQQLQREVSILAAATRQANPAPVPVPTPTLPPRPGSPTAGAANHLTNIGGHGIPTSHITPEEQAARDNRQRALLACNEATRAMAMASVQRIVLPRPNLQDFLNDPNYHWSGWDTLAALQAHPGPGTHVPRPI